MEKYDYRRAITDDVKDWLVNGGLFDVNGSYTYDGEFDLYNWIYDELFNEDSITGNGTYYYGTEEFCSNCLSDNFDLLYEAALEFDIGNEVNGLIKHYEQKDLARYFDCTIRCYLLSECIYKAVDELFEEGILHS